MQKSRIIHVNSRYRDMGTYDNFTLSINEPPLKYSSVKLLDVSIPQSFYNFTSSNNVITFQEGGTVGISNVQFCNDISSSRLSHLY